MTSDEALPFFRDEAAQQKLWELTSPQKIWEDRVRVEVPDKVLKKADKFVRKNMKGVGRYLYDGENVEIFSLARDELFVLFQQTQALGNAYLLLNNFREALRWYLNTNECLESFIHQGGSEQAYYNIWLNFYRCGKMHISWRVFEQMKLEAVWHESPETWKFEVELNALLLHRRRGDLHRLLDENLDIPQLWRGNEGAVMLARYLIEGDEILLVPAEDQLGRLGQAKFREPGLRTVNDDLYDLLLEVRSTGLPLEEE